VTDAVGDDAQNAAEVVLARQLLAESNQGRGISKSQIEIRVWNDATSHGRLFDRFIRRALGEATNRPSRQADRIAQLNAQIRTPGRTPVGANVGVREPALQRAPSACLAGLRIWNDTTGTFRTGGFASTSSQHGTAWPSPCLSATVETAPTQHLGRTGAQTRPRPTI
jgi:hypothetical protein